MSALLRTSFFVQRGCNTDDPQLERVTSTNMGRSSCTLCFGFSGNGKERLGANAAPLCIGQRYSESAALGRGVELTTRQIPHAG